MEYDAIWRKPGEESTDLFPGLVVCDGRVGGSITAGRSRLPLWCLINYLIDGGWPAIREGRPDVPEDLLNKEMLADFIHHLFEMRGEFARLLCVLADVDRRADERDENGERDTQVWWEHEESVVRVREQLRRCLESLEPAP